MYMHVYEQEFLCVLWVLREKSRAFWHVFLVVFNSTICLCWPLWKLLKFWKEILEHNMTGIWPVVGCLLASNQRSGKLWLLKTGFKNPDCSTSGVGSLASMVARLQLLAQCRFLDIQKNGVISNNSGDWCMIGLESTLRNSPFLDVLWACLFK